LARAASSGERLPPEISIRVVIDMLAGLHAAHELRDEMGQPTELVHRDVSPQNILVGTDGIARITDFGVARASTRLSATRVGQLKGKIAYMAPEQAMGKSDIDRRADVFAAGIVLWEVLAGKRLFKAENEAGTLSRVLSDTIVDPTDLNPSIDAEVAQVCMKALERDRDKRFATCAQFADALERAATAASKVASSRELAAYVASVIGHEITQQREAVRAWLARSEPSQIAPMSSASSVSAAAMAMPSVDRSGVTLSAVPNSLATPPAPRRSVGLMVVAGLLLLTVLVLGGVLLTRTPSGPAEAARPLPPPEPTPVAAAPTPPPAAATTAAADAAATPPVASSPPSDDKAPSEAATQAPAWRGTGTSKPTGTKGGRGDDLPSNPYR
jgi:serine/threonine-protein kinase